MGTPFKLHREVKRGNTIRVHELLRDGAEINAIDRHGYTPLGYAMKSPLASLELVQLLLDHGGVVRETSGFEGDINVVSVCLRDGDPHKLDLILERGADVHYMLNAGYNALMDVAFGHDDRSPC